MAGFVDLRIENGALVNPDHVVALEPLEGHTKVYLSSQSLIISEMDIEEVRMRLDGVEIDGGWTP